MRSWTIETSSLPEDSMRPLIKQIEIFFLVYSICSIKRRPRSNAADGSKTTNKRRPRINAAPDQKKAAFARG